MTAKTRVVRNRIYIDDRSYDAKAMGGGKFEVSTSAGVRVGTFQVRGRAVEGDDLGVAGADPLEQIGLLWVAENLSAVPAARPLAAPVVNTALVPTTAPQPAAEAAPPAAAPTPSAAATAPPVEAASAAPAPAGSTPLPVPGAKSRSICRVATHAPVGDATLAKARAYHEWLRGQPGVVSSHLSREPKTGKLISVSVWATEEQAAAMRYAKPPSGVAPLPSLTVEMTEVVG